MADEVKYKKLFQEAGNLIEGLIRLDGQKTLPLSFFQKRKLKQAHRLFELAFIESPDNAAPLVLLAKIEERLGNHLNSLDFLEKAWKLEPYNLILVIELSSVYGLLNMHQKAMTILLSGRENYPEEPRILFNLGITFLLLGKADAAVEIFSKLTEIESTFEQNIKLLVYAKDVQSGIRAIPANQNEIAESI